MDLHECRVEDSVQNHVGSTSLRPPYQFSSSLNISIPLYTSSESLMSFTAKFLPLDNRDKRRQHSGITSTRHFRNVWRHAGKARLWMSRHQSLLRGFRLIVCLLWLVIFSISVHRSTRGAIDPQLGPLQRFACTSTHM